MYMHLAHERIKSASSHGCSNKQQWLHPYIDGQTERKQYPSVLEQLCILWHALFVQAGSKVYVRKPDHRTSCSNSPWILCR